jgi:hypothetical protein
MPDGRWPQGNRFTRSPPLSLTSDTVRDHGHRRVLNPHTYLAS